MTIGRSKHRTLFLSDLHLGSRHCKAKRLYEFLWRNEADRIYLVGDVIEGNTPGRWPPYHNAVLKLLAEKLTSGTEVIFVPGNHDSSFRDHIGTYANLKILNHAVHERVNGDTILVIHGDETDLFKLDVLLWVITKFEALTGLYLWELLRGFFKRLIANHTVSFENKIMTMAHDMGFVGVLCGHIHMPRIADRGALYLNAGDWVYHCTAIAEAEDGALTILRG